MGKYGSEEKRLGVNENTIAESFRLISLTQVGLEKVITMRKTRYDNRFDSCCKT